MRPITKSGLGARSAPPPHLFPGLADVENQAQHLANLGQSRWTDVAADGIDSVHRNGPDVLTLRRRIHLQPVAPVAWDMNLRTERPKGGSHGDYLHHIGGFINYLLSCYDHDRMTEPCLTARWNAQIQV